jgi:phage replication-related protein YjqB (UPF0714/DUF867 family)
MPSFCDCATRFPVASYAATVTKALSSQKDLIGHPEHCSADPEKLAEVGRACGQQVRIQRSRSHYAVYTVSEVRQENPDTIVRMGANGRQRLDTSAEFSSTLTARVPHPTFTAVQAEANSEFIERLKDNGSHKGLVAIAPHGGDIEKYTNLQAERVAARLAAQAVSAWRCKGWKQPEGAFARWHITSIDIHPASFPLLQRISSRGLRYAVAFHGFGRQEILIGGTAAGPLKAEIKGAIERAIAGSGIAVRIATPDEGYGGDSPRNIVNRLTAGGEYGIQIEQSFSARESYWQTIADAVADVYGPKLY